MVIRLVAHGHLLLSELPEPLAVNLDTSGDRWGWCCRLEDTAHVMKEPSDGEHDRGRAETIPTIQKELGVGVALGC